MQYLLYGEMGESWHSFFLPQSRQEVSFSWVEFLPVDLLRYP
jgi:hypothetical protein